MLDTKKLIVGSSTAPVDDEPGPLLVSPPLLLVPSPVELDPTSPVELDPDTDVELDPPLSVTPPLVGAPVEDPPLLAVVGSVVLVLAPESLLSALDPQPESASARPTKRR